WPNPFAYYHFGDYVLDGNQVATLISTAAAVLFLTALFRWTTVGLQMRAVVESPRMTELAGVNADRVSAVSGVLWTTFAGVAGVGGGGVGGAGGAELHDPADRGHRGRRVRSAHEHPARLPRRDPPGGRPGHPRRVPARRQHLGQRAAPVAAVRGAVPPAAVLARPAQAQRDR